MSLSDALLSWFARHRRDLPWRRDRSPYRTWVSELMLQQTTVATAAPRFEAFIARFPDIAALARASEQDVVEAWAGLGYYSRARNLSRAARLIVEKFGGELPRTLTEIRSLPGIGPYTAGAILSLAYGLPEACVDGNIRRVLSRLDGRDRTDPGLRARAARLLPPGRPGEWNEALMELGATVCRPAAPDCLLCPLASLCRARAEGTVDQLPAAKARPEVAREDASYALIERKGLYLVGRRPAGLLGGLWEFPGERVRPARLAATLRLKLGVASRIDDEPLATIRHTITRYRITARLFRATLKGTPRAKGYEVLAWKTAAELAAAALTSASRKLSTALTGNR